MGRFVKGDVVVVPFPYSNMENYKSRPALVIKVLNGGGLILCAITSKPINKFYGITHTDEDFVNGSLHRTSNIKPAILFTGHENFIIKKVGSLKESKLTVIIDKIINIIRN